MADIIVAGNTSGAITISAPLVAGSGVLTLPTGSDTLIGKATTDTLTNKSIAATQLTGTIAAAALPAGSVLQVKNFQFGTASTGTTLIPTDNTIPQITEGTQFLSLAITPISATSKLLINCLLNASYSTVGPRYTIALFQDSTVNAVSAGAAYPASNTVIQQISCNYFMTSGTTSSTTFTVRAGGDGAGTITVNGLSGTQTLGGVLYSSITITEIAA